MLQNAKIDYLPILNKNYQDKNIYKRFFLGKKIDFKNKKILDYGSGNGKLFEFLIEHGSKKEDLYGVDIEQRHLNFILENIGVTNLSLINTETQKTRLLENSFDLIFCLDVIEHSPNPNGILEELKRLLKPNGVIILCTPNKLTRHIDRALLRSFKIREIFKFNYQRLHGKAFLDPTHIKEYTPNEFKTILRNHNLKIINHNFSLINYFPYLSTKSFIVHLKK